MGHVCGQRECALGAIISLLLLPSLISNKNRMKGTWFRGEKNASRATNKGYCSPWMEDRRKH